MLYERKFTIKGAKQHLEEQYSKNNIPKKTDTVTLNAILTKDELLNIRKSFMIYLKFVLEYYTVIKLKLICKQLQIKRYSNVKKINIIDENSICNKSKFKLIW